MLKKIFSISLLTSALIFSGCGSADSEGETRLETQDAIDTGNYAVAIAALEAKLVKTDEDYLQLASAYMGQAGFSFTELISIMNQSTSGNTEAFASFFESVKDNSKTQSLEYLDDAIDSYSAISDQTDDVKLYLGLAYITKATVVVGSLNNVADVNASTAALLSDGIDAVEAAAPTEVEDDVIEFRNEIDTSVDGVISESELETYLTNEGLI